MLPAGECIQIISSCVSQIYASKMVDKVHCVVPVRAYYIPFPMQIHSTVEIRRRVTVCALTKGLEHKFRVAAVNQAGQGPFVTSQIIKVNEPSKNAAFSVKHTYPYV